MKERQRWQPEEDDLLRAYVKQYGPQEWDLISPRLGKPINRDPKSCLDRWKNYLKPGIKKGSLTSEEQILVVSLQAKYGNKWKKIAAEVPGRTAKRLGKWWEVFKEKQSKLKASQNIPVVGDEASGERRYDHILDTFAEKYVKPKILHFQASSSSSLGSKSQLPDPDPVLSLGSVWMNTTSSMSSSSSATPYASTRGTLSQPDPELTRQDPNMGKLVQYCKEVEESGQGWMQHKKEATWRLSRVEQQLEWEKARKRREKMEEIEEKTRCLREEEMAYMSRIESDYREQLSRLQRGAESQEAKLVESWCRKHSKLVKILEQIRVHYGAVHGGGGGDGGGFNVGKDLVQ